MTQNKKQINNKSDIVNKLVGIKLNTPDGEILFKETKQYNKTEIEGGFFTMLNYGADKIIKANLEKSEHQILWILLRNMTYEGNVNLSQSDIAKLANVSRRTVVSSVKTLQDKGFINIVSNGNGRQCTYEISKEIGGCKNLRQIKADRQKAMTEGKMKESSIRHLYEEILKELDPLQRQVIQNAMIVANSPYRDHLF